MFVEDLRGEFQATAATGAGAGAHGQLGHAAATGRRDFADLAFGDAIADADVHGATRRWETGSIRPRMRTIFNWTDPNPRPPGPEPDAADGNAADAGGIHRG